MSEPHSIVILLVEDNPGDARLTELALSGGSFTNECHHVWNGDDAIKFLRREAPFEDAPTPDLVLLDLNLPGIDGREVLVELRRDPAIRPVPVVVLTSSKHEQDIADAYSLHANCYVTKPIDVRQFIRVVQAIEEFWITIVRLPEGATPRSQAFCSY